MEWIFVGIILAYLGWEKLGPRKQRSTLPWVWVMIIGLGAVVAALSLSN